MKKIKQFLLAFLACQFFILAQATDVSLITNVQNRQTIPLDGKWHAIIDRYENGFYNYRLKPDENGYFRNYKAVNPGDRIEYDFDLSPLLDVPDDWNTQIPELLYYEGTVWYKKSFKYDKKENKRVFLHFGAVNYEAKVYLNGEKIGEHVGGFTPFQIEVSGQIKDGDNFIVLKVDNSRVREGIPTVKTDWWNYGGITRSVKIIETPGAFVKDYLIQLEKGSKSTIKGWLQAAGTDELTVELDIPELKIKKSFTTKEGLAEFSFKAKPELWSPENPKLYEISLKTSDEKITDKIGFRTIEVDGSDVLLNGKSVFLRGICLHEEAPFRSGRAYSEADARTLLGWAKELGCNFVRLAHYPHNEHMTRVADEIGLMVWSEIPVYWVIQWKNKETLDNALKQLEENITRDRNRASIIVWSMANETPISEERNIFLKTLTEKARELDNTRLISAALELSYYDNATLGVDDPFGENLDIISFNEYIGWYVGQPDTCKTISWDMKYDKPFVISEFGGGALQGYHGPKEQRWTEEYQEWLYEESIKMLDKIENLRGTTPWILMDFRSPNRVLPEIQDGWNRKGIISDQGHKKKAYYILQKWYKQKEKEYK